MHTGTHLTLSILSSSMTNRAAINIVDQQHCAVLTWSLSGRSPDVILQVCMVNPFHRIRLLLLCCSDPLLQKGVRSCQKDHAKAFELTLLPPPLQCWDYRVWFRCVGLQDVFLLGAGDMLGKSPTG